MAPFTDSADRDRVWDEPGARERSQSVHGAAERARADIDRRALRRARTLLRRVEAIERRERT